MQVAGKGLLGIRAPGADGRKRPGSGAEKGCMPT